MLDMKLGMMENCEAFFVAYVQSNSFFFSNFYSFTTLILIDNLQYVKTEEKKTLYKA